MINSEGEMIIGCCVNICTLLVIQNLKPYSIFKKSPYETKSSVKI